MATKRSAPKKPKPGPSAPAAPAHEEVLAGFGPVLLRQNDPRWGGKPLGLPKHDGTVVTIGHSGCLLTDLTIVLNLLTPNHQTPLQVNETLMKAGVFNGPALSPETAAHALGLVAPDKDRYRTTTKADDVKVIAAAIDKAFDEQKLCILQVDHDSAKVGGDPFGDHFVVAFERHAFSLSCIDPAPGRVFAIEIDKAVGESKWSEKDVRLMRVVSVIPIWKAS